MNDPDPSFQPSYGVAQTLSAGLRRVVAPNPSPMTFRGTNTYLLGETELAVIDPGPNDSRHLKAILSSVASNQRITHIFVTHAHLDHSPLARELAQQTGAPVLGFGTADAGRSPVMQALAASGMVGGGEGVDNAFAPDVTLAHGDKISGPDWTLEALHTPGHMANHLSFAWGKMLFSGDLVMGWASSLVSPPDGDLTAFMQSLTDLQARDWHVFHAGHGAPVLDPANRLQALLDHRRGREHAILAALGEGPATAQALARAIYTETPAALLGAATRNVLAHLIDLEAKTEVEALPSLSADAKFRLR